MAKTKISKIKNETESPQPAEGQKKVEKKEKLNKSYETVYNDNKEKTEIKKEEQKMLETWTPS